MSGASIVDGLDARDLLGLVDEVCRLRHVTRADVCGRLRTKAIAAARHEIWWRLRNHPDLSFSFQEIAHLFARDHSTIIAGVRAHRRDHPEIFEAAT